jgi:hypothetical protein
MGMSGQLPALVTLPWEKSPWYPFDKRLGEPQSQIGHNGEEKKIPVLAWNQTPVIQLVVQSLYLLSYPGSQYYMYYTILCYSTWFHVLS